MTAIDLDALRTLADNHREVADAADALILALEALDGTPEEPFDPTIRVGDTVEYVGTETPSFVGRRGEVRSINRGWVSYGDPLANGGAYLYNLRKVDPRG